MRYVAVVAILLAGAVARADRAGIVKVDKGSEPEWLSIRVQTEDETVSFVLDIDPSKARRIRVVRENVYSISFRVSEKGRQTFVIPVRLTKVRTGLVCAIAVPVDVARKATLHMDVQSTGVLNGQDYVISLGSYVLRNAEQPGGTDK